MELYMIHYPMLGSNTGANIEQHLFKSTVIMLHRTTKINYPVLQIIPHDHGVTRKWDVVVYLSNYMSQI